MNILFPLPHANRGGSDVSASLLIRELQQKVDTNVTVFIDQRSDLHSLLSDQGVAYRHWKCRLPAKSQFGYTPRMALAILERLIFIILHRIQIIHVNDGDEAKLWRLLSQLKQIHLIRHIRSNSVINDAHPKTHFICVSNYVKSNQKPPIKDKCVVIDNPFDMPCRNRKSNQERLPICLFLGNFIQRKQVHIMPQIFKRIKELSSVNPVLFIAGRRVNYGLKNISTFFHAVRNDPDIYCLNHVEDPLELLRASKVLVAPYLREPFGRTIIEAMSVGTPTVAFRHGGIEEIIKNGVNGILVEAHDIENLAVEAVRLIEDSYYWRAMSKNAVRSFNSRFSTYQHADEIIEYYKNVLKS